MLVALPILPLSTVAIARDEGSITGWLLALLSFLLYGVGTLISGSPFLALVHDSAPYERRGQVISIVQIMLVTSFAFVPALYAALLPSYDPSLFSRLVLVGTGGAAFFWLFSVWGEERRAPRVQQTASSASLRDMLSTIWAEADTRRYALFLGLSAFFAFMQDAVLEPFGGDVFDLAAGETTRFNAYWGVGVLVAMVGATYSTRRRRPHQQVGTTIWGLVLLGVALALMAVASHFERLVLVMPVLVLFGVGFGIFTVGGVSLLMAMSVEERAGSYLALWSMVQLVARGAGIAAGGLLRDLTLNLTGRFDSAYAILFLFEALGLLATIPLLRRVDVLGFAEREDQAQGHPRDLTTHAVGE
jgi:BCD family chlorophyll transporter-like MFS transporter